jgi:hypothetical protein
MLTDQDLQTELAAAFRAHADTVAAKGVDTTGIFGRAARNQRRRRTAVRAAAMLAVISVAVAVPVAIRSARPGAGPADQAPGLLLDAAVTGPPPPGAADRGMPPYYVTADHSRPAAYIRDSRTGKILSVMPLPRGIDPKASQITAAGDDRTFALALLSFPRTRFYLMHVAANGRSARLAPLPVPPLPAGAFADAIALSPDGSKLAVALQTSGAQHRELSGAEHGAVRVVSLATGAVRTWTTARTGIPGGLSWAGGDRELGFFWQGTGAASSDSSGLWVLDTASPGGNLMSGRRIVPGATGGDTVQYAQLSPNGTTAIAAVTYTGTARVGPGTVVGGIVELSAWTGHPLRTLLAEHAAYSPDPGHAGWYVTPCILAAADVTGKHLLVSCDRFGRLDRGRFAALPGAAPQTAVAAAW